MKVRNAVKDYQRRLTELDNEYSRARDRLESARTKRAGVVEEHDRLVAAAESDVDDAIAAMALEAGPALTASLLEVEVSRVRRLLKQRRTSAGREGVSEAAHPAPSSGG